MCSDEKGFMQFEALLGGVILAIAASGLMCIGLTERARADAVGELTASMIAQEQLSRIEDNLENYIVKGSIPWLGETYRLQQNGMNFKVNTTMSPQDSALAGSSNGNGIYEAVVIVSWQNPSVEQDKEERVWRRYFRVAH